MTKIIETVILEKRPRLKSCNIFITVKTNFNPSQVNLKSNSIIISNQNITNIINIDNSIQFVPKSLSGLNIEDNLISFRVNYQSTNRNFNGSYRSEIIKLNENPKLLKNKIDFDYLKDLENILIKCRNCTNQLSELIKKFNRVLPLPSENCNPNDWFCHKSDNAVNLDPNICDLFYNLCSFKLNSENLIESSLRYDKTIIFCKRCLAWLGTSESKNVNLWHCTVIIKSDSIESKLQSLTVNEQLGLINFKATILHMIDETIGIICKGLIECKIDSDTNDYLLIWVLDRKLDISMCDKNTQGDEIYLKNGYAIKLLFKHLKKFDSEVTNWQSDVHVQNFTIAMPMLTSGLNYLNDNAKLMSKKMTKSSEDFIMSYIFCDL